MASHFLTKLGLRAASAAALSATTVALGAAQADTLSLHAMPHFIRDCGVSSRDSTIVTDNNNGNQNNTVLRADNKPAALADLA